VALFFEAAGCHYRCMKLPVRRPHIFFLQGEPGHQSVYSIRSRSWYPHHRNRDKRGYLGVKLCTPREALVYEMFLYFMYCKGMSAADAYKTSHIPSLLQQWGVDINWMSDPKTQPYGDLTLVRPRYAVQPEART
jgi:hypothetical protein